METKLIVEKNVPIPKRKGTSAGKPPIYPFRDMNVNDCFFAPIRENETVAHAQQRVMSAAFLHGRKYSKKFSVRQVENGVRCWRIE